MVRISKDPKERRQELIEAAETLFLKKGYENTAVSDIVREINVAQGTFYYHFFSKSDILEAVVEKNISVMMNDILQIAGKKNLGAPERLNEIVNILIRYSITEDQIIAYMHKDSNIILHDKMGNMVIARLTPILTGVIAAGVSEGKFSVKYPNETAELIMAAFGYMLHQADIISANSQRKKRAKAALEESLNRMLASKDFKFRLKL